MNDRIIKIVKVFILKYLTTLNVHEHDDVLKDAKKEEKKFLTFSKPNQQKQRKMVI